MRRIGRAGPLVLAAGCALLGCQRQPEGAVPPPGTVAATPGPGGVQAVTVTAEAGAGQYRFVPDTIDVRVGRVRLTFRNTGNTPHNLTFDNLVDAGRRVAVGTLHGGAEETVDFAAGTPGRYRFVCTIHQALGQTGVLNVER